MNLCALLGSGLAFRWVPPAAMGVWHTLLLANSYLTVVRLGLINGMGRELPFALGRGDLGLAQRIAGTCLAYNLACSLLAGAAGLAAWAWLWPLGPAWRIALPAMALVSACNLHLTYLQATFRSDSEFARLSQIQWLQAAVGATLPVLVFTLGFGGLCLHAALQAAIVTAVAHRLRPLRVGPRFDWSLTRQLLATGLPLFVAGYLQTLAAGFDRVILLRRGGVEAVGYFAPALAVIAAMGIVPGAITTYVYPRMSYALGQGHENGALRRMALLAGGASVLAGLPAAAAGWLAAPGLIERFFPQYLPSIPAVRWSLAAGLLWSLTPVVQVLGSLKAWRSLGLYVGLLLAMRWTLPWLLSRSHEPLEGVARGNTWAAAITGAAGLLLVYRATRPRLMESAP
jgi:O-antigen/teichoic acid export membrane protein